MNILFVEINSLMNLNNKSVQGDYDADNLGDMWQHRK